MLKLILGRAGSGKTTAVLQRLCRAGQERPQVLMVPEQQSHEAERALCRAGGDQVSLYAEVLSFSRLANRIFQAAGGLGEEELDAGGRLLCMALALDSVYSRLRVYAGAEDMPKVMRGLGIAIISTSKGVMTDKRARKENIGGEVLAFVW